VTATRPKPQHQSAPAKARERGNALLEFALAFVLLWACFAGVFQYGYSMYIYNGLQTAVTNGAIYASRATYDTRNNNLISDVTNLVVYGDPAGGTVPLVPGLTPSKVSVVPTPGLGYPQFFTVSIVNYNLDAVFTTFRFDGKPSYSVRFAGMYMTPEP
jgi:Flp pilus assembly protein TadG